MTDISRSMLAKGQPWRGVFAHDLVAGQNRWYLI